MSKAKEENEEWRDIPNYEGYYQASNLGRVRSLDRTVIYSDGRERFYKGKIIEGSVSKEGYRRARLSKDNTGNIYTVSQLVAITFLGHKPNGHTLVVDHINGDRADDRLENLRIVTHRANCSTCFRSDREHFDSKHVGVNWSKSSSKWESKIKFNGKKAHLGYFADEVEASNAYQLALSKIKRGSFNPNDYKAKWTSKHRGVFFNKASGKWMAKITIDGKPKHLGTFPTELEAHNAYQNALKDTTT